MSMEPLILKMLDMSTGHMTREDAEFLTKEAHGGTAPVYELSEYGWLVYVGEIEDNWPDDALSPAFRKVLEWAAKMYCDYVRFDRDGRVYEFLPTFDW